MIKSLQKIALGIATILLVLLSPTSKANINQNGKITIVGENITLEKVLRSIEIQQGIKFQLSTTQINLTDRMSCKWVEKDLEEVLKAIFLQRGCEWKYGKGIIYIRKIDPSREVGREDNATGDTSGNRISLNISDTEGNSVPSATILVKGMKMGAVSGTNGGASFRNLPLNASFIISCLGFKTVEIDRDGRNVINIKMLRDVNVMKEQTIVSNGFQMIAKERATGSFEKVDNKTLNEQVGSHIIDRLKNVATGVLFSNNLPTGGPFLVRGYSTIQANAAPLIVLDNFVYTGDINSINPNDIESFTVLKDAAASSIWGARAGNGVVVITTKRGRFNRQLQVNFNSTLQTQSKPDLFSVPQMSSSDLISVQKMLFQNSYYSSLELSSDKLLLPHAVEIMIKERDGNITKDQADQELASLGAHDVRNDFLKYVYATPFFQQYSLNVNGGNSNSNYYVSGGYDNLITNLSAKSKRVTLLSKYNFAVTKNLDIDAGINYAYGTDVSGENGYGLNAYAPYTMLANANGQPLAVPWRYREAYIDTVEAGGLKDWHYYPLNDWKHDQITENSNNVILNIGLSYRFLKHFKLSASYGYTKSLSAVNHLYDTASFYARDLINTFTNIDQETGTVNHYVPEGGVLNIVNSSTIAHNGRTQLDFDHAFGRSAINAIVGFDISQTKTESNQFTTYGYIADPYQISSVDFANQYPTYITGAYSYISGAPTVSPYGMNRFVSFYGNAAYVFNNKYTFSISGRRDASNLFGYKTNDRWKPLWSTGLSWNLSSEQFYKIKWLPILKFRATYGYSGNVAEGLISNTVIQYNVADPLTNLPYAEIKQFGNPSLRWETSAMLNLGLDFGIIKDIASGSIEYFKKKGTDLFGTVLIDNTAGVGNGVTRNYASSRGHGFDIRINTSNINRSIKWRTEFALGSSISFVAKYFFDPSYNSQLAGNHTPPMVGNPLFQIISYKWKGLDHETGNPVGVLYGKPSSDYVSIMQDTAMEDLDFKRTSYPTIYGSLRNYFQWKRVSLSFNISYKLGYNFFRPSIDYSQLYAAGAGHSDFARRWQKPGDEEHTNVPSMVFPNIGGRDQIYQYSSALIENGGIVRFEYLNIGYDLLGAGGARKGISRLAVNLNIANLGVIWKANHADVDPEYLNGAAPPKSFALGVQASF